MAVTSASEAYPHAVFEQLDYVYMPSRDVAADVTYFTDVLGARLVFSIDGMGTRVAMVELTSGPPRLLLAGHLDGEAPVLVFRVADLESATGDLERRGWRRGHWRSRPARSTPSPHPAGSGWRSTSGRGPVSRPRSRVAGLLRARHGLQKPTEPSMTSGSSPFT